MAFSNTPGPIKPFPVTNSKGEVMHGEESGVYVIPAGRVGLCIGCFSFVNTLKISVTADEAVCKDTKYLVDQIWENIIGEIERMKDV